MRNRFGLRLLAVVPAVVAGLALGGTAWGKGGGGGGGGGGGTTVDARGVVAFGDGTSTANRGTWAMDGGGAGLQRISTQIYPMDVSRGRAQVTVLLNATAGFGLFAMRAHGSNAAIELIPATTRVTDARFSLDGAQVLYRAVDGTTTPATSLITVADVVTDGGGDVTGIESAEVVLSTTDFLQGMDFSRDGSQVVLSLSGDIWTLDLADGTLQRRTSTAAAEKYPRWSPVDDRIACTRYSVAGSAVADVVTIDAVTGATRTVVAGASGFYAMSYACWAQDGGNLLFLANKKNVGIDLYQVPSGASGSAVCVTSGTGVQENTPAWGW